MLLDEPFSALDALTKASLQEWCLNNGKEWEKNNFIITHDVEEALFLSNRIDFSGLEQQPITTLTERIVPLDHNRTRKDLYKPEVVLALKDELLSMLQMAGTRMMNRLKESYYLLLHFLVFLLALWEVGARIVDEMYIFTVTVCNCNEKIWRKLKPTYYLRFICQQHIYVVLIGVGYFYRTWGRASDVNESK